MKKGLMFLIFVIVATLPVFAADTYLFDDEFNGPGPNYSDPAIAVGGYYQQIDTTKWEFDGDWSAPKYSSWGSIVLATTASGYRMMDDVGYDLGGAAECYTQIAAATYGTGTMETIFILQDTTAYNVDAHIWIAWRMSNPTGTQQAIRLVFNVEKSNIYIINRGGTGETYAGPIPHTYVAGESFWIWVASASSTHRVIIRDSKSPTAFQYMDATFSTDPADPVSSLGRLAHGIFWIGRTDWDYFRAGDIALPVQVTEVSNKYWELLE